MSRLLHACLLFFVVCAHASGAERVLLPHDFNEVPAAPWTYPHGLWKAEGGVLHGAENPAEHHPASLKVPVPFQDGVSAR